MPRTFEAALTCLAGQIMGEVRPADGVPEETLAAAERRHGVLLPDVLRSFYRTVGRNPLCKDAFMHFRPPGELELVRDGLLFCEENQGIYFNAIPLHHLGHADPPVLQGNFDDEVWSAECERLSSFLLKTLCWQAVNGLDANGQGDAVAAQLAGFPPWLARVEFGDGPDGFALHAFAGEGVVVCYFPDGEEVYAAARRPELLERFSRESGIELVRL